MGQRGRSRVSFRQCLLRFTLMPKCVRKVDKSYARPGGSVLRGAGPNRSRNQREYVRRYISTSKRSFVKYINIRSHPVNDQTCLIT